MKSNSLRNKNEQSLQKEDQMTLQVHAALKSIGTDWIKVTTGSVAAIVILIFSTIIPMLLPHPWMPWILWTISATMWSWTWGWAFVRSWSREHAQAKHSRPLAEAFCEALRARCDDLILSWHELHRDYEESPKQEDQPRILQTPMSPVWVSSVYTVWPYRVGVLQGQTEALRQDLSRVGILVEAWNHRMSGLQILEALKKYKEQVATNEDTFSAYLLE
jgi:hypothetical protein